MTLSEICGQNQEIAIRGQTPSPNPSHNYTTSGTPVRKISGYAPAGFTVKTITSKWQS